ncbi:hypothetical protein SAMN07250955_107171 [Arboricoccus pini]|uniref:DUF985 domain-containing protein n=2 Tax=Arboricoccus pini TaxID=1963835 RepID=A0A212RDF4_9PROT|nr:hypothetical protein SAMN07250955_107171 [Arboricoccus pini]
MTPEALIDKLGLAPHPEGGHYVETYRAAGHGRSPVTAIYFLLGAGERSHWHRVDATEIWLWHGGAPLTLRLSTDGETETILRLGPELDAGQMPQRVIPPDAWQSAESEGDWTLVSCIVAPGFDFSGFVLAADGWQPGQRNDA